MVRELEKELSEIEEIQGKLRITRTYSLVSLSFFRNLTRIGTRLSADERFGLQVVENQNLQELFPNNVTIEHGRLFFHFNPKLCYHLIDNLRSSTFDLRNVSHLPPEDVATNSNGDKVACEYP